MKIYSAVFLLGLLGFFTFTSCDGVMPGSDDDKEDSDDDDDNDDDDRKVDGADEKPDGFGQIIIGSGINTVPNIVDPVLEAVGTDEETDAFNSPSGTLAVEGSNLTEEVSGISLGRETVLSNFSDKSYAACVMVNRARGLFHFAASPDQLTCELAFMLGKTNDFYDEKYHVIEIKGYEDGDLFSERIKFKITGTSKKVTGLEIYRCEGGVQFQYVNKTIGSDGKIVIHSKNTSEPENSQVDQFWGMTKVEGKVDDDQKYVGLKTVSSIYSNNFSNGSVSYVKERLVQSSENIFYTGVMSETRDDSDDKVDQFAGFIRLIDRNKSTEPFSLLNYYLGDGALAMKLNGEDEIVQGWSGSDKAIDNTSNIVERVKPLLAELPEVPATKVNLKFEGNEIYDCKGKADLVLDDADLFELVTKIRLTEDHGDNDGHGDDDHGDYGGEGDEGDEDEFCDGFRLPQENHLQCDQGTDKAGA
jgi:hypothetical protein